MRCGRGRAASIAWGKPSDARVGACWPFIKAKLPQLMYGFYPELERWRVDLTYALGAILLIPLLIPRLPYKGANAVLFFGLFPLVGFFLLVGGTLGLSHVETRAWGGFLVTLVISFTGIICSLPLGIVLALGRRSTLPIVRTMSIAFIEIWRGGPADHGPVLCYLHAAVLPAG